MDRIYWLDAARAVAIILVVFTHAHEMAGVESNFLVSVFYTIDRLGVPIFFMISGGLILPRLANADPIKFYKKRIPQFIILLIFWSIFTFFIKYYSEGLGFIKSLMLAVNVNNGVIPSNGSPPQMWFMYSIIGLYLIAPFLAKLLKQMSNYEILLFLFICVMLNQFKSTVGYFLGDLGPRDIGVISRIGSEFTGSYLVYFIVGYLVISRSFFYKSKFKAYVVSFSLLLIPSVTLILIDEKSGIINNDMHWYGGSMFILLSGVGLFLLLKLLFEQVNSKILNFISMCSFGIYLTHYAFIFLIWGSAQKWLVSISDIERMMIYFTFSILASILLTYCMLKNKFTKYFVS